MNIESIHYEFKLRYDKLDSKDKPDLLPWQIDIFINRGIAKFMIEKYDIENPLKRGFETDQKRISQLSSLHIKSPELQPAITPINLGNGKYEVLLDALGNNISGQYFRYMFATKIEAIIRKKGCSKKVTVILHTSDSEKTSYSDGSWIWDRVLGSFGRSRFVFPHPDHNLNRLDSTDTVAALEFGNRYNNDKLSSLYLDTTNIYNVPQFDIDAVFVSYIKYPNRVFIGGYDHPDKLSTATSPPVHCDIDDLFHHRIIDIAVLEAQESINNPTGIQVFQNSLLSDT